MHDPLEWVSRLVHVVPAWLVLFILGACVALESGVLLGMALPGATAVLALGVAGAIGVAPLPVCLAVASAAAVTGTQLAYRSGARSRDPAESYTATTKGRERWARAQRRMQRHDLVAIAVAQFVVVARTLVPRLAGLGGTSWSRFSLASVPAATLWATALTTTGYHAGANVDAAAQGLPTVGTSLAVVIAGLLALMTTGPLVAERVLSVSAGPLDAPMSMPSSSSILHRAHND